LTTAASTLEGVRVEKDVPYLEAHRTEKLDLYLPMERDAGVKSPGVVIIHGGGWMGGDKAQPREINIGTTLARAGYVCASANYMMEEGKRWPTNVMDCKNAVRFLRKNAEKYGVDPDRIGVIGGSAGGHLALMVAYTTDVPELEPTAPYAGVSDRVSCVVNMYGITDVRTRRKADDNGNPIGESLRMSRLFPQLRDEDPDLWQMASPVSHVTKSSPPTLILHGTKDTTVDRDQASELAATLKYHGVEHRLIWLEGIGHTFDLQSWKRKPLPIDLRPIVVEFLDKHLKKR
jgi:acetyl esterase/lipase